MGLKEYKAKRKFNNTPEPEGKVQKGKLTHSFVIQKHHASHLHYDFRLELEGVLKSWAIPKGPSMKPADKRLAMMVEDHPIEYGGFEGIIPPGNYGAGTVMLWDQGTYHIPGSDDWDDNEKTLKKMLHEGNLKFILEGTKVKGEFALVRMNRGKGNEWLLMKKKDKHASEEDITAEDRSVVSGRNLEEIKRESVEGKSVWHSPQAGEKELTLPAEAGKAPFPHDIKPMMATLVNAPFDREDWLFEIKWDGFRAIAEVNFNDVSVYSRNMLSFNGRFPAVVQSLAGMGTQAVFDGEICVVDENGRPGFQLIQNYQRTGEGNVIYCIFDLLYYKGYDLRSVPLIERKELLKKLIPDNHPVLRYSDHVLEKGTDFLEVARKQQLEGIVAKKTVSTYQEGTRGKDWLKIKIQCEQEAVVAGYTQPRGGRKKFGALVLGVYQGDRFVYIGHTGGGFNDKSLQEVFSRLEPLRTDECPFEEKPKTNMPVTWVKPEIVVEVKFQEWTNEGIMRVPIFQGVREDKSPREVTREIEKPVNIEEDEKTKRSIKTKTKTKNTSSKAEAADQKDRRPRKSGRKVKDRAPLLSARAEAFQKEQPVAEEPRQGKIPAGRKAKAPAKRTRKTAAGKKFPDTPLITSENMNDKENEAGVEVSGHFLKFTNLKKVFWPEEGYTKQDLLEYYHKIAPYILPYLKDRPESLRRNPNGYKEESFFQKDMPASLPGWIETVKVYSGSNDKDINYMICQDEASLLYMVNLGCIEINPWLSRKHSPEYPDYMVIDLDPQDVPFGEVTEVAQVVKDVLDEGGITGYCKTSGSRGLHIYIPMGAAYHYDQVKTFAELIVSIVNERVPAITSLERMPKKRKNKIYLDYLQNRMGQTLAAPYCIRPRAGATVSTPLEWKEVKKGLDPNSFNIKTIFKRLEEKGDLFISSLSGEVNIQESLQRLSGNE